MKLFIQKAKSQDTPELVKILTQAVKYKVDHDDMSWGDGEYTKEEVAGMLKSGNLYSAFLDNEIIGVFLLQWQDDIYWDNRDDQAGYIHQLAIKQGFHGQGLGEKLIDWAGRKTAKKSKKYIRLDCSDQNQSLCEYYETQGFKQTGTKSIPDKNYTAALYQKPV